ncbi:pyridoxal phosphate-dependent decarboxylase family protein [Endothiovibrio diazotrophicus]
MEIAKLGAMWNEDGSIGELAAEWAKVRAQMVGAFPTYYAAAGADPFAVEVGEAINELSALKPAADGPAYLGSDPKGPYYGDVTAARLPQKGASLAEVNRKAVELFQGMPNWNHPLTMPNVIPPANKAGIIAAMMTDLYSPNIIEGEYAWNVLKSEMETAAILSSLIGWDPEQAGGVYTFGGSGCYFYGVKYAITHSLGEQTRCTGIREDAKLLVSQQGHYCKLNSTDWSGLGMDNIIEIETDPETNAMSIPALEKVMQELHAAGTPIVAVICTMGTTDAFAIDSPKAVRGLIEKYPNPNGSKPLLYCDAVIGWSWLTFRDYDFDANPLGFSDETLKNVAHNHARISEIEYADAVGCDFHKTGWAPYNCSIFVMKDLNHFRKLMTRPGSAYLQDRVCYNPGLFTLEVSRSGSYSMAGWATLQYFGAEGFQSMLGGVLEMEEYLRHRIASEETAVCVNADDHGFVTLFRLYPKGVDAAAQYEKELNDPSPEARAELIKHNELQAQIGDLLWQWFRDGKLHEGHYGPYVSYTSGFRKTNYNADGADPKAVIYALKSFPMNININPAVMECLLQIALLARDEIEAGCEPDARQSGNCRMPYTENPQPVDCDQTRSGAVCHAVENLLSGVPR